MKVNGPRPDGAAAGGVDDAPAVTAQQSAQHHDGGAHAAHEGARHLKALCPGRVNGQALALPRDAAAQRFQNLGLHVDVVDVGAVLEHRHLPAQQRRRQQRKRRVFCAPDFNLADQRISAIDCILFHISSYFCCTGSLSIASISSFSA